MAHPNIDARRERVASLLKKRKVIRGALMREIAREFECSIGAIYEDELMFLYGGGKSIYASSKAKRKVLERDENKCQYCGDLGIYVDHVIPRKGGGHGKEYNLVCACGRCNARKSDTVWIPRNVDKITAGYPAWEEADIGRISSNPPP